jgi:hypothetical protein
VKPIGGLGAHLGNQSGQGAHPGQQDAMAAQVVLCGRTRRNPRRRRRHPRLDPHGRGCLIEPGSVASWSECSERLEPRQLNEPAGGRVERHD